MCFFALSFYFASLIFAKSALEEVIDDELVWQEVKDLPVDAALISKMIAEIEGIKRKERTGKSCIQYAFTASSSGYYPCFNCENGLIYLNKNETWKIGKTCLAEDERYSGGYPDARLLFRRQFEGSEIQCLIVEKVKLYAYRFSKENTSRSEKCFLPPGNKIYR
jgi:hypothetical protein